MIMRKIRRSQRYNPAEPTSEHKFSQFLRNHQEDYNDICWQFVDCLVITTHYSSSTEMGIDIIFPRFESAFHRAGMEKPVNFFIFEHNFPFKPDSTKPNVPTTKHEFHEHLRNHQSDYDESSHQRLEAWYVEAEEMADKCEKSAKAARERGDYDTMSDQKIEQAICTGLSQCLYDERSILASYLKWVRKELKERFP